MSGKGKGKARAVVVSVDSDDDSDEVMVVEKPAASSKKRRKVQTASSPSGPSTNQKKPSAPIVDALEVRDDDDDEEMDLPGKCRLCDEDQDVLKLGQCRHDVCQGCLRQTLQAKSFPNKMRSPACCPIEGCQQPLSIQDLLLMVTPASLDIYVEARMTALSEDTSEGSFTCPQCGNTPSSSSGASRKRGRPSKKEKEEPAASSSASSSPTSLKQCSYCDLSICPMCHHTGSSHPTCPMLGVYRLNCLAEEGITLLTTANTATKTGKKKSSSYSWKKSGWAKGTGYGGSSGESSKQGNKSQELKASQQEKMDKELTRILQQILTLLPTSHHAPLLPEAHYLLVGAFEESVPVSSPISRLLRSLLVNDCMTDIALRKDLFFAALDIAEAASKHFLLSYLVTKDLVDESSEKNESAGISLLGMINKLVTQAQVFQRCGAQMTVGGAVSEEEEAAYMEGMALALKISAVKDIIDGNVKLFKDTSFFTMSMESYRSQVGKLGASTKTTGASKSASGGGAASSSSGKKKASKAEMEKERVKERVAKYDSSMGEHRFGSVPILATAHAGQCTYSFLAQANQGDVVGSAQKRLVRIMQEMSSLSTSLPVGHGTCIIVRVDENRPDVIKCLISGPPDTPYSCGLFEFDIFLPGSYPNTPPHVQLVTTGGGRVRMGPNLYNSGKVCLSLLGTWSGPGWDPKRSTLLQVLVSIQSLIFVPEPFFCEPGFESQMGTPQGEQSSKTYNYGIRQATLEYAILGQMNNPCPQLRDVILRHFGLKREEILELCRDWVNSAPTQITSQGYGVGVRGTKAEVEVVVKKIRDMLSKNDQVAEWIA